VFLVEMTGDGWSQVQLGTAATTRALGDAFSACPPLTSGLFGTYLRYFTQTGYLPAPLWLAPVAGPGHRGSGHASQREAS
jgi:hypothetical protein